MSDIELPAKVLNVRSYWGGLGDHIARIPAFRYAIRNFTHLVMNIYVPDYLVEFYQRILGDELVEDETKAVYFVHPESIWERRVKVRPPFGYELDFEPLQITSLSIGLVEHGFLNVCNRLPHSVTEAEYPVWVPASPRPSLRFAPDVQLDQLGEYIVVTTGFTSAVREWPVEEINKFIELVKKNTSLNVVLLGDASKGEFNESIRSELTEDLRNKTTIIEAADILSQASCVVGVDNGLLHLASCSDVPVIWGFTSVDPKHRVPVRNGRAGFNAYTVLPSTSLACRFCQAKYYYVEHDYRNCFQQTLNSSSTIPCTKDMLATKFFSILQRRILNK